MGRPSLANPHGNRDRRQPVGVEGARVLFGIDLRSERALAPQPPGRWGSAGCSGRRSASCAAASSSAPRSAASAACATRRARALRQLLFDRGDRVAGRRSDQQIDALLLENLFIHGAADHFKIAPAADVIDGVARVSAAGNARAVLASIAAAVHAAQILVISGDLGANAACSNEGRHTSCDPLVNLFSTAIASSTARATSSSR